MKKVICLLAFCTLLGESWSQMYNVSVSNATAYAQYGERRQYGRNDLVRPVFPDPFLVDPLPVEPTDPLPLPIDPFPNPLVPEKPGQCPVINIFTPCVFTPENNPCSRDFQCPGRKKCCSYGCGTRCLLPVGTGPIINKKGKLPQCLQPKQVGFCRVGFRRWYYNKPDRRCELFIYGGCGGNQNNFESKAECLRICGSKYKII